MEKGDRRLDEPRPGSFRRAASRLAALSWAAAGLLRVRKRLPRREAADTTASRLAALSWAAAGLLRVRKRLPRREADTTASRLAALSLLAAGTFRARRRVAPPTRRLRNARREAGLCPDCGGRPRPGRVRCAECLTISADTARHLRAVRRGAGLCWRCGAPSEHFTACESCRVAERSRDASRRAARRERKSRTALLLALARQRDRVRKS